MAVQRRAARKLTKKVIDALQPEPKRYTQKDSQCVGFGIRVTPTGAKSYTFTYRWDKKIRRYTIGSAAKWTVAEARTKAENLRALVNQGVDPQAEKVDARDYKPVTFKQLAHDFIENYAKLHRKTWETDHMRLFPTDSAAPVYKLHSIDVAERGRLDFADDVIAVIDQIKPDHPVAAKRLAQTINRVLNVAVDKRHLDGQFYNITQGWVSRKVVPKETKRDAYLLPSEIQPLLASLKTYKHKQKDPRQWERILWLTLLTGARQHSEIHTLRWENVNFHAGVFVLSGLDADGTKNGEMHTLPMTPRIRAILETTPKLDEEWVFPARTKTGYPGKPRKVYQHARETHQFVHKVTAHSLRHGVKTWTKVKLGLNGAVVDAMMNHSTRGMDGVYVHPSQDDVLDCMLQLDAFIVGQLDEVPTW